MPPEGAHEALELVMLLERLQGEDHASARAREHCVQLAREAARKGAVKQAGDAHGDLRLGARDPAQVEVHDVTPARKRGAQPRQRMLGAHRPMRRGQSEVALGVVAHGEPGDPVVDGERQLAGARKRQAAQEMPDPRRPAARDAARKEVPDDARGLQRPSIRSALAAELPFVTRLGLDATLVERARPA